MNDNKCILIIFCYYSPNMKKIIIMIVTNRDAITRRKNTLSYRFRPDLYLEFILDLLSSNVRICFHRQKNSSANMQR